MIVTWGKCCDPLQPFLPTGLAEVGHTPYLTHASWEFLGSLSSDYPQRLTSYPSQTNEGTRPRSCRKYGNLFWKLALTAAAIQLVISLFLYLTQAAERKKKLQQEATLSGQLQDKNRMSHGRLFFLMVQGLRRHVFKCPYPVSRYSHRRQPEAFRSMWRILSRAQLRTE